MYPNLSYLFHDLFGTEPDNWLSIFQMFGLMLVLCILTAAYFFRKELIRREKIGQIKGKETDEILGGPPSSGELISNAIFGFIIGFKVPYIIKHFDAFKEDAAGIVLSGLGYFWLGILGAGLFAGLRWWQHQKSGSKPEKKRVLTYPHDRVPDIAIIAAVSGVLGAKIFDLIENLPAFFADPIGMLFSGSGLAIYGGLIGGFLAVSWYLKQHDIPFWPTADAIAPSLILGYGIGRMGCQLSGDGDWGIVAKAQPDWWFFPDWLWSYTYPHNVNNVGNPIEGCEWKHCYELAEAVYPTPLYEIAMAFIIFGVLWALRKRLTPITGMLFFLYVLLNGVERFLIEKIRVNKVYELFGGLEATQAEVIAVGFMLVGLLGIWFRYKKYKS